MEYTSVVIQRFNIILVTVEEVREQVVEINYCAVLAFFVFFDRGLFTGYFDVPNRSYLGSRRSFNRRDIWFLFLAINNNGQSRLGFRLVTLVGGSTLFGTV